MRVAWVLIALWGGLVATQAAEAPSIVIPGKRGVPVIINGGDASYCVVEGEFGLDRPGQVAPNIIACPLYVPVVSSDSRSYFPAFGRRPGYGRREIEPPPNRRLPPPAERYYREWGVQSMPLPATIVPPANVEANVHHDDDDDGPDGDGARRDDRDDKARRADRDNDIRRDDRRHRVDHHRDHRRYSKNSRGSRHGGHRGH